MGKAQPVEKIGTYFLACIVCVLAGCETPPSVVEQNFGSSVRNAIALQTAPASERVPGLDGVKGEAVLRTYQGDVAKPEAVNRDLIQINVGK